MTRMPTGVSTAPPPWRPPGVAVTAGSSRASLSCSTSSQARRYDMPSSRAAAEIDPVFWIASRRAILPGPMRSPLVRSRRMLRRVSDMDMRRLHRTRPHDREPAALVKARFRPPNLRHRNAPASPHDRCAAVRCISSYTAEEARSRFVQHRPRDRKRRTDMLTIPDEDLRRWLAEDVPYGDLTIHALGFRDAPGRIRGTRALSVKAVLSADAVPHRAV